MRFLYVKEAEIPEEVRGQYADFKNIEIALGDVDTPRFADYANSTILITLVPRRSEKPRQILESLSRKHNTDVVRKITSVIRIVGDAEKQ